MELPLHDELGLVVIFFRRFHSPPRCGHRLRIRAFDAARKNSLRPGGRRVQGGVCAGRRGRQHAPHRRPSRPRCRSDTADASRYRLRWDWRAGKLPGCFGRTRRLYVNCPFASSKNWVPSRQMTAISSGFSHSISFASGFFGRRIALLTLPKRDLPWNA